MSGIRWKPEADGSQTVVFRVVLPADIWEKKAAGREKKFAGEAWAALQDRNMTSFANRRWNHHAHILLVAPDGQRHGYTASEMATN